MKVYSDNGYSTDIDGSYTVTETDLDVSSLMDSDIELGNGPKDDSSNRDVARGVNPDSTEECFQVFTQKVQCFSVSTQSEACFKLLKYSRSDPDSPDTPATPPPPITYPPDDLSQAGIKKIVSIHVQAYIFLLCEYNGVDSVVKLQYTTGNNGEIYSIDGVKEHTPLSAITNTNIDIMRITGTTSDLGDLVIQYRNPDNPNNNNHNFYVISSTDLSLLWSMAIDNSERNRAVRLRDSTTYFRPFLYSGPVFDCGNDVSVAYWDDAGTIHHDLNYPQATLGQLPVAGQCTQGGTTYDYHDYDTSNVVCPTWHGDGFVVSIYPDYANSMLRTAGVNNVNQCVRVAGCDEYFLKPTVMTKTQIELTNEELTQDTIQIKDKKVIWMETRDSGSTINIYSSDHNDAGMVAPPPSSLSVTDVSDIAPSDQNNVIDMSPVSTGVVAIVNKTSQIHQRSI